jgi:hypothetical protein
MLIFVLSAVMVLGDLTIKPTSEVIAVLNSLVPKANMLPRPVCVHKIIPALSRVLQMAVNDFGNRDSREASRQVNLFNP